MPHRAYLFIGPPASGKGTHGRVIGELPGYIHFSMGAAFRNLKPDRPRDQELLGEIRDVFASGELVPDEIVLEVFQRQLDRLGASGEYQPGKDILLLDGIPRTAAQAEGLRTIVKTLAIFVFACDRDLILDRVRGRALKEGRADDSEPILEKRLEIYEREIKSLLDCYSPDQVIKIDSSQSPAHTLRSILEHF